MIALSFGQLAAWTEGRLEGVLPDQPVLGMSVDSRQVIRGGAFWALPGNRVHGEAFVSDVWSQGVVAVVREEFQASQPGPLLRVKDPLHAMARFMHQGLQAFGVKVVGITGSVGKTSVKELTRAVLATRFAVGYSQGNYNTNIGLPLSFFQAPPDPTHFVAEMGMRHSGEIREMTRMAPPDVAIITTIGPNHMETLGSLTAIQNAKAEILEGLVPSGRAVLNREDPLVWELKNRVRPEQVVAVGPGGDIWPERAVGDLDGITLRLASPEGLQPEVRIPWPGLHQAANAALAAAAGYSLGMDWPGILQGLASVNPANSRIQRSEWQGRTILADVYNASPRSMMAALDVLRDSPGRRLAVLGDMLELGSEETAGHESVGRYAVGRADVVVAVGQRAVRLAQAARGGGMSAVYHAGDRHSAAALLRDLWQPGDVVLFKASRGMALETLITALTEGRHQG